MKIRMKIQMSGTRNGQRWPKAGETADIPTGEATHLVASGIAEQVTDEQVTEPQPEPEAEAVTEPVTEQETATPPAPEATEPPAAKVTEPRAAVKRTTSKPRKTAAPKASPKE